MFGATRPGQTVRWTVLRAGESRELVATATEWPDRRERIVLRDLEEKMKRLNEVSDLDEMHREVRELTREIDRYRRQEQNRARIEQRAKQQGRLRYAGVVGDAEVEVRGSSRVLISESPEKDRVVINLGESVVVIQLAGHTPKKKADSQK
jgi:pantothenate kinase